jgi:hypothetical protein
VIENVGRRSEDWSEEGSPTDVGDKSLNGYERNALFWNRGAEGFVDVGYLAGANRIEDGRGVVVSDFDHDGRQDLLIQNLDKPVFLLMGRGDAGHWLQLELEGTRGSRDAVGARVTAQSGARRQARQVSAGSGFLSSSSRVLHFGLGDADRVERLEILWPSGQRQVLTDVPANQRLKLREPDEAGLGVASPAPPR